MKHETKVDRLINATGIAKAELDDPEIAALQEFAETFLRGGGVLSLQDWEALGTISRAAFVEANRRVWVERAVMIGRASQGPVGAAAILSGLDGGATTVRLALDAAAWRSVKKLEQSA